MTPLPHGWTRHVDPWGVTIYRDRVPVACVSWCAAGWYWWCQPDAGWHHGTRVSSRDEAEAAAWAALGLSPPSVPAWSLPD